MTVFQAKAFRNHEMVVFCDDAETGLKGIIAIHNTSRGPGLGGCRMWPYESEEEALTDVLRLSRGMTYKSALANLDLGGAKSVIIGDPKKIKTPAMITAMAKFVDRLKGGYIIAEDVGTSLADMDLMRETTPHAVGTTKGGSGDPSPATAYGVFVGLQASVQHKMNRKNLKGLKVAVQGLGNVGYHLCQQLHNEGAELIVTDISEDRIKQAVKEFGAKAVGIHDIYTQEADVYSPCALGATLNDETVSQLKVSVVAGSANNQLHRSKHGEDLHKRGILYAPDYVINSGGVINVSYERTGYNKAVAYAHIGQIYDTLIEIYTLSEKHNIPTSEAADRLARRRFVSHNKHEDAPLDAAANSR